MSRPPAAVPQHLPLGMDELLDEGLTPDALIGRLRG